MAAAGAEICFETDWYIPYRSFDLKPDHFTSAEGKKQSITMMVQNTHSYLKDEHAVGFMKAYKSKKFAFAALLPEEGMTPEEYLLGLTPERLFQMLSEPVRSESEVVTGLPKFKYELDT